MTRPLMRGVLLVLVVGLPLPAQAQPTERKKPPVPPVQPPVMAPVLAGPPIGCGPDHMTIPRLYLQEDQHECALPQLKVRDAEIGRGQELEVAYREEKRVVRVSSIKERTAMQPVMSSRMEPCQTIDPCTGQICTTYKSVPCMRVVKVSVFERVLEDRVVKVKVPYLKPGGDLVVKRVVVDETTTPAIVTRFRATTVPVEIPLTPPCPPQLVPPAAPTPTPEKDKKGGEPVVPGTQDKTR